MQAAGGPISPDAACRKQSNSPPVPFLPALAYPGTSDAGPSPGEARPQVGFRRSLKQADTFLLARLLGIRSITCLLAADRQAGGCLIHATILTVPRTWLLSAAWASSVRGHASRQSSGRCTGREIPAFAGMTGKAWTADEILRSAGFSRLLLFRNDGNRVWRFAGGDAQHVACVSVIGASHVRLDAPCAWIFRLPDALRYPGYCWALVAAGASRDSRVRGNDGKRESDGEVREGGV